VRFASECLAFSNVPEPETLDAGLAEAGGLAHHPRYKEGVPRDPGAGWDFADVTDHYVASLFGVDPGDVRSSDPARYLALCRRATAEVMADVQRRWRPRTSGCAGALVLLLRDPRAGAGWGLVDSTGAPKSPYYALKRTWAPVAAWIVDEGLNGLVLHLANDTPQPLRGELAVELHRADGTLVERACVEVEVGPRSGLAKRVESVLGHFVDASYAYRFGPPGHELTHARWEGAEPGGRRRLLASATHFRAPAAEPVADLGLVATAEPCADGAWLVTASAERPAFSVAVEAQGHRPSDAYFHLAPRHPHHFVLHPLVAGAPLRARLRPLNARSATPIDVISDAKGDRAAD
jgi:beta-mannosidase